jgi:Protein of unknown function (DUF3822)
MKYTVAIKTPLELLKRIPQPELWLHLHPYALSYLVFDPGQNKVMDLDVKVLGLDPSKAITTDMLTSWMAENEHLLQLNYSKVIIAVHSNTFTILPEASDHPDKILETLGYIHQPGEQILADPIRPGFIMYYTLPETVSEFMEHRFHQVQWHSGDYGSIRFRNSKLSFKNHLVAHLYGEDLSISLKQNGQIQYFNKFAIKAKEDLLYYIRLSYDQLQLNPNEFATYLYGFIEEKSPAFSTSYGYIRNFEIDRTLKHGLGYLHIDEHIPMHYYVNLLALGPCV